MYTKNETDHLSFKQMKKESSRIVPNIFIRTCRVSFLMTQVLYDHHIHTHLNPSYSLIEVIISTLRFRWRHKQNKKLSFEFLLTLFGRQNLTISIIHNTLNIEQKFHPTKCFFFRLSFKHIIEHIEMQCVHIHITSNRDFFSL